jgi:hypothetical protein
VSGGIRPSTGLYGWSCPMRAPAGIADAPSPTSGSFWSEAGVLGGVEVQDSRWEWQVDCLVQV